MIRACQWVMGLVAVGAIAGCAAVPWGLGAHEGISGNPHPPGDAALVVALDDTRLKAASAVLQTTLWALWPDGIHLDGDLEDLPLAYPTPPPGSVDGGPITSLHWEGLRLEIATAAIHRIEDGLEISVTHEVPDAVLRVQYDGVDLCEATVTIEALEVSMRTSLYADTSGAISAALDLQSVVNGGTVGFGLEGCPPSLVAMMLDESVAAAAELVAALGDMAAAHLSEGLADELAPALTLDLGFSALMSLEDHDDTPGSCALTVAPTTSGADGQLGYWLEADTLHVPFTLDLQWTRHSCVPAFESRAPPITEQPSAQGDDGPAISLHQSAVTRVLEGVWASGAMCGDRVTSAAPLTRDLIDALWPELAARPEISQLQIRIWPGAQPDLFFQNEEDGVEVRLATGPMTVEIVGWTDDTRLLLTTVTVDLEIRARATVDHEGAIWLEPTGVIAAGVGATAGWLDAPDASIAAALMAPLTEMILGHRPVFWLPTGYEGLPTIGLTESGWLTFGAGSSGDGSID